VRDFLILQRAELIGVQLFPKAPIDGAIIQLLTAY
jgi:hypothetical protein